MRYVFSVISCVFFAFALIGCGQDGLRGEYVTEVNGKTGGIVLSFKTDSQIEMNGMGLDYKKVGETITIYEKGNPGGNLKINEDGSLSGDLLGIPVFFKKK